MHISSHYISPRSGQTFMSRAKNIHIVNCQFQDHKYQSLFNINIKTIQYLIYDQDIFGEISGCHGNKEIKSFNFQLTVFQGKLQIVYHY